MTAGAAERGAVDLVEEAIHLLRRTPPGLYLIYYCGAVPFALAFLTFWTDMRLASGAGSRLASSAAMLAFLFLWMKACQSIFASRLVALAGGTEAPPLGAAGFARCLAVQGAVQPCGILVLPLSLLASLPFPWVFAFFQNLAVFGDGSMRELRPLLRRCIGQSAVWPRQNHVLLAILFLLGFFAWLDVAVFLLTLPGLAKSLLGVETVFSRSGFHLLNSTFFAGSVVFTYLLVDPLVKASYALRCYYGDSRTSGADLLAGLRRLKLGTLALCLILLVQGSWAPAIAASPPQQRPPEARHLTGTALDESIREVLKKREYRWRSPREKDEAANKQGWLGDLMEGLADAAASWFKTARRWFRAVQRWLEKLFPKEPWEPGGPLPAWRRILTSPWFLLALLALVGGAAALLVLRARRRAKPLTVRAERLDVTPGPAPGLEEASAGDQPEEVWKTLAAELIAGSDFRRAVRALFLAALAGLGRKGLVRLERHKSNGEYALELGRWAGGAGPSGLVGAFAQIRGGYERAWYGGYDVTRDQAVAFAGQCERMLVHEAP